jgi:hypothetical protein
MNIAQEDIDEVMKQEDMKSCCDRVKQSMKHNNLKEKKAFKFGVSAALGGVDELVEQLGNMYGQYRYDDDDVRLLTRNIEKKLQEVE